MCCSGIDDRTLPRKNQAGETLVWSLVVASVFLSGLVAQVLAGDGPANPSIGQRLPGQPGSGWRTVSGTAREVVRDRRWVVREPKGFCRRLELGDYIQTEGQLNEVRFEWGTDCPDNQRADGFSIQSQGRRLRLHPIHRPQKPDLLLVGRRGGMGPDLVASHVDLSGLPKFDARAANR